MPRPKRQVLATFAASTAPPDSLPNAHEIARVIRGEGNNLFRVELPSHKTLLVEMPSQFRSAFFLRRGGFVVVDTLAFAERENKIDGEIVNFVSDEKAWRRMAYWPSEFGKRGIVEESGDEEEEEGEREESRVGRMPSSDEESDG